MTSLSPSARRRSTAPDTRVRVRADEAVITQWLLDQTTPTRRSVSPRRRPTTDRRRRPREVAT